MGFFKKSTSELEAELIKAKKQKELLIKEAKKKDVEINNKIAEKEKRDQLMFDIKRLKQKPRSQAELAISKQRVARAKNIASKLGKSVGGKVLSFLKTVKEGLEEEPKRPRKKRKKSKAKKKKRK